MGLLMKSRIPFQTRIQIPVVCESAAINDKDTHFLF